MASAPPPGGPTRNSQAGCNRRPQQPSSRSSVRRSLQESSNRFLLSDQREVHECIGDDAMNQSCQRWRSDRLRSPPLLGAAEPGEIVGDANDSDESAIVIDDWNAQRGRRDRELVCREPVCLWGDSGTRTSEVCGRAKGIRLVAEVLAASDPA